MFANEAKVIREDASKLSESLQKDFSHIRNVSRVLELFPSTPTTQMGKKELEKELGVVRSRFKSELGIKMADACLYKLNDIISNSSIHIAFEECRHSVAVDLIDNTPSFVSGKIAYAVRDSRIFALRLTLRDEVAYPLIVVEVTQDTFWLPVVVSKELGDAISENACLEINTFVYSILHTKFAYHYKSTVVGPRGGTLSLGRVYTNQAKEEGAEVVKQMPSGCIIKY